MFEAILLLVLQAEAAGEPGLQDGPPFLAEIVKEAGEEMAPVFFEPVADAEPAAPIIDIPRDTPVRLMVLTEVSTKDHEPGHRFRLRVNDPVIVNDREVIPIGAIAWGELLSAEKSGNVGKSGKLSARLLYVEHDGREIALDGEAQSEGKSGKGETILGVLAAGPLGLFAKGNNAKLKAGEKMTAFIAEDVSFGAELAARPPETATVTVATAEKPTATELPEAIINY